MALRETESAYRRRRDNEDLVRQASAMFLPAAIERAKAERERIRQEVEADQFGYVWWRCWERKSGKPCPPSS